MTDTLLLWAILFALLSSTNEKNKRHDLWLATAFIVIASISSFLPS
jgi:hypothetical protein